MPDLPPGIPVAYSLLGANGQLGSRGELLEIERTSLPPSLFEIPEGYGRAATCPAQGR